MMISLIGILSLALSQQISFGAYDPDLDWKTIDTEHFYIHYEPELEESAQVLANRVEPVYDRITKRLQWEPNSKVHVIFTDQTDLANGLSTPIPYNSIYLYPNPPMDGTALDHYDDWLTTLFMHEFTHTVHIDTVGGINKIFRWTLGRIWVPNALQQQWALEGLAVYEETAGTTGGRGRSPFVDMFLRTVSLEGRFIKIDRATYWNDEYPYGNSAYWYGVGFHQYLAKKFGEEKIHEFSKANASSFFTGFFNFKASKHFGKGFYRLWDEWNEEEKQKWSKVAAKYSPQYSGSAVKPEGQKEEFLLLGRPAWSDDGKDLYASVKFDDRISLRKFEFKENGEIESEILKKNLSARQFVYHDNYLVYSKFGSSSRYKSTFDLWAFDIEKKISHRITKGLRLRDPIVIDNKIYAVRTDRLRSSIVSLPFNLKRPKKDEEKNDGDDEDRKIFEKPEDLEIIFRAEGINALSKPSLHGNQLVFSMKIENGSRDLYLINLETKELKQLTNDEYEDHDPVFSPSGEEIIFSSSRPLAETKVIVPNIYTVNVQNGEIFQATDVWTGTSLPAISPGSDQLALAHYSSNGFTLHQMKINLKKLDPVERTALSSKTIGPTIIPEDKTRASRPYSIGNTLWPRLILPFYFYTETDSAIGAQTGSSDPLGFHSWFASAYHLFTPNRPGGFLNYVYKGFSPVTLFSSISAGILNYGRVLVDSSTFPLPDIYYERRYEATFGFSHRFRTKNGPTGLQYAQNIFYKFRSNLLSLPTDIAAPGKGDLINPTTGQVLVKNVTARPEEGHQWGVRSLLSWSSGISMPTYAISPVRGTNISLSAEYTPDFLGSEFDTLTTILAARWYKGFFKTHAIALRTALGAQWLDPLYQRTFRLGGSFGESPFATISGQTYPLRGLPPSQLQGEGIVTGSFEYRFPFIRRIPGIGTAPIWFKNLHIALFADGGQTFRLRDAFNIIEAFNELNGIDEFRTKNFQIDRFTMSTGIELRSDISFSYAPPLTVRLGYGYTLYLQGKWIGDEQTDQLYFLAGTSF